MHTGRTDSKYKRGRKLKRIEEVKIDLKQKQENTTEQYERGKVQETHRLQSCGKPWMQYKKL